MKYSIETDDFSILLTYNRGYFYLRIIDFNEELRGVGDIWSTHRIQVMSYDCPEIRDEGGYLEIYLNGNDSSSDNRKAVCYLPESEREEIFKALEKYRIDVKFKKLKVI